MKDQVLHQIRRGSLGTIVTSSYSNVEYAHPSIDYNMFISGTIDTITPCNAQLL
jgi:hypothetical protein